MKRIKLPLMAFALSLGLVTGCNPELGDQTKGELGNVEFSYHESCFFGCSLDQPVLRGSTERISVTGPGNQSDVVASSSAPEIASFSSSRFCDCERSAGNEAEGYSASPDTTCQSGFQLVCDNYFAVKTGTVGDAKIELRDATGNLIDRTTVHVRDAHEIRFGRIPAAGGEAEEIATLELAAGESAELIAHPYADDGAQLLGEHGFVWQVADPAVAGFDYFDESVAAKAPDDARIVHVRAVASGQTTLSVGAGGAASELVLVVK